MLFDYVSHSLRLRANNDQQAHGYDKRQVQAAHGLQLLNARYAAIPDNVDLVILEAAPPRVPPISASDARGGSSFVLDPAALATLAQLRALQALQAGTAAPGQFFAV